MPQSFLNRKSPPRVLIVDADYTQMDPVVEKILDTFPLPWKGKRIVLKPNILGPYPPEKGITTHPSLVGSLVKALKRREAICQVGDNPGLSGYAANERCAKTAGILEAADGCFVNFAKDTASLDLSSRFVKKVVVSKAILDADLVINVPKFKTHLQTKLTGAIKNMFGILVGAEKARVHLAAPRPEDFSEALVDIYQIRIPDLTVMDAVVGMEGNGPSGHDLRPIGKILASADGVAVDGLMTALAGVAPTRIDTLRVAKERDLGEIDPSKMKVQGAWSPLEKFKLPLTFASQGVLGTAVNKILYRPWVKPRLRVRPELCTQCQVCIQHCPTHALSLKEFLLFDKQKCISCYCCYELCPSQAIELTGFMRWIGNRQ